MGRRPKSKRDAYGAWLHHLRRERKLTQHDLAKLTGIPQTNIAHWERTGKLKGRSEILRLAEALKISVQKFLRVDKK